MKFYIENLGPLKKSEIELSNFNIITGKNHTGKTYLAYTIYNFLKYWKEFAPNLEDSEKFISEFQTKGFLEIELKPLFTEIKQNFNKILTEFNKNLHKFFSAEPSYFQNTFVYFDINDLHEIKNIKDIKFASRLKKSEESSLEAIKDKGEETIIFKKLTDSDIPKQIIANYISDIVYELFQVNFLPKPFIISAERTGIHLFQRELDINRNVFFEKFSESKDFDLLKFLEEVSKRYTRPIRDNISRARSKDIISQRQSFYAAKYPEVIEFASQKIFRVSYKLIDDQFYTVTKNSDGNELTLPLYLSSTSSRSLLDLFLYLKYLATESDLLIIDEPELNLHPELQINLVQVLAMLSNYSTNILLTTHSDYIVKEVNNLIVLSNDFDNKQEFYKEFGYNQKSELKPEKVRFYIAENDSLSRINIDNEGIERTTFDDTIEKINLISDYLYTKISSYEND